MDTRPYDGNFLDASCRAHNVADPSTLEAVGDPSDTLAFYVNGINTDLARQRCDMEKLKGLGYRVLGIHNATAGVIRDLGQCVADKLDKGQNPAVNTVKQLLRTALATGQNLTLIGHSQGALICSRALFETQAELLQNGQSLEEATRKLGLVNVHTAGGAAYHFPDGPSYHHRINWLDPIALLAGLAMLKLPGISAGAGAVIETFCRVRDPRKQPECPEMKVKPSLLDRALHGVSVYFG